VIRASATQVVVRVPARAAGVYDVHVFAPDGRYSVLTAALTYTDATGGTAPGGSTPGGAGTGGTGGSPGSGGTGGGSSGGGSGSDGSAGAGGSGDVRTGPGGLRLVRSAVFSGLRTVWSTDCSTSCRGVRV
jgi:hypothetical protein